MPPLPDPLREALTRKLEAALDALTDRAAAAAQQAWDALPNYDGEPAVETYVAATRQTFDAIRAATVQLSNGYNAALAGIAPPSLKAGDVDTTPDTRAPFISMWQSLASGNSFDDAVASGRSRVEATVVDHAVDTTRKTGEVFIEKTGLAPYGYGRIANYGACDWCLSKEGIIFDTADKANFGHTRCKCMVAPLYDVPSKHAQMVHELRTQGGFTIDPDTDVKRTEGFAVAIPNHSLIVDSDEFFADPDKYIDQWLEENKGQFEDPEMNVGGWWDKEHDEIVLDPSKVVMDRDEAIRIGIENDQQAIFDLVNFEEIDTGGTGQRPEERVNESTRDVWATLVDGKYVYDPKRVAAVHDPWVKATLADGRAVEHPTITYMGGGPAAGKSTLIKHGHVTVPEGTTYIAADEAKLVVPEYDKYGAAYVHLESSVMSKRAIAESTSAHFPTMVDGTLADAFDVTQAAIAQVRANGMEKVVAEFVTVDLDKALFRAEERLRTTGRGVPLDTIRDKHRDVSLRFPELADANIFDEMRLWDTNTEDPTLIFERVDGVSTILDATAYAKFIAKGTA